MDDPVLDPRKSDPRKSDPRYQSYFY
jgi:hypothetical protein